jgi:hypothetical protein
MTSHPAIEALARRTYLYTSINAIPNTFVVFMEAANMLIHQNLETDIFLRYVFFRVIRNLFCYPTAMRIFISPIHNFYLVVGIGESKAVFPLKL